MDEEGFKKKIEEMHKLLTSKVEPADDYIEEILKLSSELDQLIIEFYLAEQQKTLEVFESKNKYLGVLDIGNE